MNLTCDNGRESSLGRVLGKRALVYIGILVFAFALLLILNSGTASAAGPTYVDSDITDDTTWTADDSPYIVTASIEILPDATLTIESNVTVMFDAGVGLTVSGGLIAVGTADEPITFTANDSTAWGFWSGILVYNNTNDVVLENVFIMYGDEALVIHDGAISMDAVEVWYVGTVGIGYIQTAGDLVVDLENVNVNHANIGLGFMVWDGDLHLTLTGVSVNDSYEAIWIQVWSSEIVIEIVDAHISNSAWGLVATTSGDITALISGTVMEEMWDGGVMLFSTDGNIDVLIEDSQIGGSEIPGSIGVYLWTPNGDVEAMIDSSEFMLWDNGLQVDALEPIVNMEAATFDSCWNGAIVYADGNATVTVVNSTFVDNLENALRVDANLGDVILNIVGGHFNTTQYFAAVYAESYDGDVIANLEGVTFSQNMISVLLTTWNNDVHLVIDGCWFLGDVEISVMVEAAGDANVEIVDTIMNGETSDALAWYYFDEIEYEYEIIYPDPANRTSASWMTMPLPFDFPFYGEVYDTAYIARNGIISFDSLVTGPTNLGSIATPMIVPIQDWFSTDRPPYYGYKVYDDKVIIQWDVYRDNSYLRNVFQVILYENGDIQFNYHELEAFSYSTYSYGLSFGTWDYIDMRYAWNYDAFTNDFSSVYFTYTPMTELAAIGVLAEGNITFSMTDSVVSNYAMMGVVLLSGDGWIDMEVSGSAFEYLVGIQGVLTAFAWNGTISANIVENSFSHIVQIGVLLISSPSMGGEDVINISDNAFTEAGMASMAIITEIWDMESEEGLEYTSTRTIMDNVGVNSGGIVMSTYIEADEADWTITINEMVKNNTFEGIPKAYFGFISLDATLQPMTFGSLASAFYGEFDGFNATVVRNIEFTDNTLEPSVINGDGIIVDDMVDVWNDASVDYTANVVITGNVLQAVDNEFDEALSTGFEGWLGDGNLSMVIDVVIEDNDLVSQAGNGYTGPLASDYGISFWSYLWTGYGKGDASMDVMVSIEDNLVDGFYQAVYVDIESASYQQWTDMTVNAEISIINNEIVNCYDGIYLYAYTDIYFWNYFPPYEEEITSTATAVFNIDISGNMVNVSDDGIEVYLYAYGQEDYYGVFNNAVVDVDYDVAITDNVVITGDEGIYVDSYISANGGECQITRNLDVVITGNEISGGYWGIGVQEGTYVWAASLDFADSPVATSEVNVLIDGNIVSDTGYGIWTYAYAYANYGQSMASVVSEHVITNNIVDGCYYNGIGLWVDYWTNQYGAYTSAEVNAAFHGMIEDNMVTDLGSWAEGIDVGAWLGSWATGDVVIDIIGNTLIGSEDMAETGIYVYGDYTAMFNIIDNVIQGAEYGIEAYYADVLISGNAISVIDDYGIYLYDVTGVVSDNEISDCESGILLYYCFDMVISGNEVTTDWGYDAYEGLYGYELYNVTIENNLFNGFGYGVEIDYSEEIVFIDNMVTNSLWTGAYLYEIYGLIFSGNEIVGSLGDGVEMRYCYDFWVEDNLISEHMYDGLYVRNSYDGVIGNNTIMNNGEDGLYMYNNWNIILYNGIFSNNYYDGIYVSYGTYTWIVDSDAEVRSNPVYFAGNVIVADGGVLTLDFVKGFYLEPSYYHSVVELKVDQGGKLVASHTDFGGDYYWGWSLSYGGYLFNVWGELMMDNCGVYYAKELYLGPTSYATIHSSVIMYNAWNGINVDNSAPIIAGTTIQGNWKSGVFIQGADAAPVIKDCIFMDNERGIYAYQTVLGKIVDNLFVGNSYAGIYAEEVTGSIHNNIFLMNGNAIYLKSSVVTVEDNQIGYSVIMDLMAEYMPLFMFFEYMPATSSWWYISPEMITGLMGNEKGIYAVDSVVECSGNVYGMLKYAVYVVNSELTFADSVEKKTLIIPYFDDAGILRNISLPIFVYDGIYASDSTVMVQGAYIEVLDDAVFLENCVAEIWDSVLVAGDFDVYAMDGTECTIMGTTFSKIKAENPSVIWVGYAVTVIALDSKGNPVAGVAVVITDASGEIVAEGETGNDGKFVAYLVGAEYTKAGADTSMNPYTVHATFDDGEAIKTFSVVDGPVEVMVEVPAPEPWNTSPAIALTVLAALLIGILLLVVARP